MQNLGYTGKRVQSKAIYVDFHKSREPKRISHKTRNERKRMRLIKELAAVAGIAVISALALTVFTLAVDALTTPEEQPEHEPMKMSYVQYDAPPIADIIEEEEENPGISATRLGIVVTDYKEDVNYQNLIDQTYELIHEDGSNAETILSMCEIFEIQRNMKIEETGSKQEPTNLFNAENTYEQIDDVINPPWYDYTEQDLKELAAVVYAEGGSSDWVSVDHMRAIASVVMNRVVLPGWGDTVHDVIHRPGQYPATCNNTAYNQRSYDAALYVLENGPTSDAVYQANFPQGDTTIAIYDYPGHSTTWICK